MKRHITYICMASAAVLAFASCNKNLPQRFDDRDVFVAFEKATYTVDEDYTAKKGVAFRIPVTLASAAGIETSVKYAITASTSWQAAKPGKGAVAGVDYDLVDKSGVLSFNAENRTCYIEFKTIVNGVYTGDLEFEIEVFANDDVTTGSENKCKVKISDVDHPLTFMLGDYTMSGVKLVNGTPTPVSSLTMKVMKDKEDPSKVWFYDLMGNPGWAGDDMLYYGTVNENKTEIILPFGQVSEYKYNKTTPVKLLGVDAEINGHDSGSLTILIKQEGNNVTLDFGKEWGMAFFIENAGSIGIWLPGTLQAVKK